MMSEILQAILAVFAMIGIITAVYFGLMKLLNIRQAKKYLLLILPAGIDHSDAECMIRGAHLRARLIGTRLLAVDCGLAGDAKNTAELVCSELEGTRLCPLDALAEYLER